MPTLDIDPDPIYVFSVGEEYLFSQYFERTDVFDALTEYYNGEKYRFEVPADEIDDVTQLLEDEYFEPVIVDDLEPFCVLKEKYTEHAEILRNSVANWERDGQRFFLMQDDHAVRFAEEQGATRIEETNYVIGI
jgi:hypothetical protein